MGRFSKIKEAKHFDGGVYFEATPIPLKEGQSEKDRKWQEAVYLVRLDVAKGFETRKKKYAVVFECTVCESTNPKFPRGSQASVYTDDGTDAFLGNVKHYVSVVSDTDEHEIDEPGIEMTLSKENPYAGTLIGVRAKVVKKTNGDDFTKVTFFPATKEQVEREKSTNAMQREKWGLK